PAEGYTRSGQGSGSVGQRAAGNPPERQRWDLNGQPSGARPMLHPTALYFPNGVDGFKFYLVYTPYPGNSDENPVMMRSNDGVNFTAAGIPKEPLIVFGAQPPFATGNLA